MSDRTAVAWVIAQFVLIACFALLPRWSPLPRGGLPPVAALSARFLAAAAAAGALYYALRGIRDLGGNRTPLPTPLPGNRLVLHGVYALVRHPLYSSLLHAAVAWTAFRESATHLAALPAIFLFFDQKAKREEALLLKKHPEYGEYRRKVRKFVPWIY